MKTAISIPDETFEQVEDRAAALGMSRSEFYTRVAQRYLQQLDAESLVARIEAALDLIGPDDSATLACPRVSYTRSTMDCERCSGSEART